jgi:perosamine synthetase
LQTRSICCEALLKRRRDIALLYRRSLADVEFQPVMPGYEHGWWGFTILLDREVNRDGLMRDLLARDIETRPMFYPIHTMPMYTTTRVLPVAEGLAQRGIMLPMHADLTDNDVRFISESVMVSMYANQRAA